MRHASRLVASLALVLPSLAGAQPLLVSPVLPSAEDEVILVVSDFGCAPGEARPSRSMMGSSPSTWRRSTPCFRPFYWTRSVELGTFEPEAYPVEVTIAGAPSILLPTRIPEDPGKSYHSDLATSVENSLREW